MTENKCGSCTMCCKLMGIPEIKKPASQWCPHCAIGKGCNIYEERPQSCGEFECGWLKTGGRNPALRPDKTKVVFALTADPKIVLAMCDPGVPNAWEQEPVLSFISSIVVDSGIRVIIGWGTTTKKLALTRGDDHVMLKTEITMSEPDANGVQWFMPHSLLVNKTKQ